MAKTKGISIKVPSVEHDTLCYKQPSLEDFHRMGANPMIHCMRVKQHEGPHSWEADMRLVATIADMKIACQMALNDRQYKDWPKVADSLIAAIKRADECCGLY